MNKALLFLLIVLIALVASRNIEENKYLEDEHESTLSGTDDLEEPELEEVPTEEAQTNTVNYNDAGRPGDSSSQTQTKSSSSALKFGMVSMLVSLVTFLL
jgi:hypothetical protein